MLAKPIGDVPHAMKQLVFDVQTRTQKLCNSMFLEGHGYLTEPGLQSLHLAGPG